MSAISSDDSNDQRLSLLTNWVKQHISTPVERIDVASQDASFRRYFRIHGRRGTSIAMDSPPQLIPLAPFIARARLLRGAGINVPKIMASNEEQGFALLSDLGYTTYLQALADAPELADRLYGDAIHVLLALQLKLPTDDLPPYDEALLRTELGIFHEWLVGTHLGLRFDAQDEANWAQTVDLLVASALAQPTVFVHRDYHSRNLMVGSPGDPGVLDFQDAVAGPVTYDLVSLLKDCYITWPADTVTRWVRWYRELAAQTTLADALGDEASFMRAFHLMGVQRHVKAAGIFARLKHRDGRDGYLPDIPRTLQHIIDAPHDGELNWLVGLVRDRVLPAVRAT